MTKSKVQIFIAGGVVGSILMTIVAFSMGWILTSGAANAKAVSMSESAVKAQLVPICVHQFENQDDHMGKLESLRALDTWKREDFVESTGSANMPGTDSAVRGIARDCAASLVDSKS